jgi:RNA polymerase sigma-70 factor (ECF subfamily)
MDDLELLEGWRTGDKRSEAQLLRRYFDVLYRFFANKVPGDADDLVQLTITALVKNRDSFEQRSSFRAYVLSIARFQLYEFIRTRKRMSSLFEYDTVTAYDLSPSPSALAAEHNQNALLLEALRRIPLNFQVALELHYWEELSGPELAEVLGVPLDTAYSRLRKARQLLKDQLRLMGGLGASAAGSPSLESGLSAVPRRVES